MIFFLLKIRKHLFITFQELTEGLRNLNLLIVIIHCNGDCSKLIL